MHHSQAVRHRALTSVCVGSNPTGVVRLTFIVDYHVLHFKVVLLSCTSLDFVQLKAVQDRLRGLGVYIHSHVKTNLSRSTPYENTPNILLFLFLFLDSRYKRYLPIWDKGIPVAC